MNDELFPQQSETPLRERISSRALGFLARHSTFVSRWSEVSVGCACVSACPSCIGLAAGGLILPAVMEARQSPEENSSEQL